MNPVVDEYGTQRWFNNGDLHRTNGAAIIHASGDQCWYKNGLCHRTDGAAIIHASGDQYWYLDHKQYSFLQWIKLTPLKNNAKLLLQLTYNT